MHMYTCTPTRIHTHVHSHIHALQKKKKPKKPKLMLVAMVWWCNPAHRKKYRSENQGLRVILIYLWSLRLAYSMGDPASEMIDK